MHSLFKPLLLALFPALPLLCASGRAQADPGYYVVTAYDNAGQRTIDTRYWTVKRPGRPVRTWPEIGLGYGVTSRWYTEVFASGIGASNAATRLSSLNWQNEFLLTQGEWPVDVAVHASLIRDFDDGGWVLELGPVLQTDIGRTQLNLNLFFERQFGLEQAEPTRLKYQWQVRHRTWPRFQVGIQGFGELGPWNHWSPSGRQSHRAGPAIFGSAPIGDGQSILYQAAFLAGTTYGRRGNMFSMRVQYAF